VGNKIKEINE
jgi:hypothetical protein